MQEVGDESEVNQELIQDGYDDLKGNIKALEYVLELFNQKS